MKLWPRTLSLRLAQMFALSSCVLLGAVAAYLYHSLEREILWRDVSFLWLVDAADHMLIEVNPASLPLPKLPDASSPKLGNDPHNTSLRLAWLDVSRAGGSLKLIAGKRADEREQCSAPIETQSGWRLQQVFSLHSHSAG